MDKLLTTLGIIVLSLVLSQLTKYYIKKDLIKLMAFVRILACLVLNPIVLINSYWILDFSSIKIIALPIICLIVLSSIGFIGNVISKKLNHNRKERASFFAASTFSNLGAIASLIVFIILGEEAFAIASMYLVFEALYSYLIAYPIAKTMVEESRLKLRIKSILKDPIIMIYTVAIFIGFGLNFANIQRPNFMNIYNESMIPIISFLLILSIGYEMEISKIKSNLKEGFIVLVLKFIISPIIALSLGLIFFRDNILILKVLLIMSTAPCAFNTILVPVIYNADKDIANSCWVLSMLALLFIVPIQYMIIV